MLNILKARRHQKFRTLPWPKAPAVLPDRFRGRPTVDADRCSASDCEACAQVCPVGAISRTASGPQLDLGRCLFCGQCADVCPRQCITFSRDYRMAARKREDLQIAGREFKLATALEGQLRRMFGRSLRLRQVSAGGCNACEADTNVLSTVGFDLARFGIQFVASPRHADGLFITGPVTENMRLALQKTYAAVAEPKLVIACGVCAISGGAFANHPEAHDGAATLLPIDLFIPGCPPHPMTILDGLVRLLGGLEQHDPGNAQNHAPLATPCPTDKPTE